MKKLTLDEIISAVNGKVILKGKESNFCRVNTDTRKLEKGDIFIALKGERFNGNEFIEEASHKGASLCIVSEENFNKNLVEESNTVILVKDTNKALLDLAKYYKSKLNIKIVGITGSTGKTSTKDLVAAALSHKYKVFKTKGNFNNEIGLPLMMLSLDDTYDVAVLEMGMSDLGEIHRLAEVAKPDIAIITNIGISHIENLKTQENILKAKMEIVNFFNKDNVLILNNDDELLSTVKSKLFKVVKIGVDSNSDYVGGNIILNEDNIQYDLNDKKQCVMETLNVGMLGKHSVYNSLLAVACARELGLEYSDIIEGLKNINATSMRLDIIKGDKFTIINDCYNASPDSVKAAVDVLVNMKSKRKIAILGTMRELGHMSYDAHLDIGKYTKENGVDYLFTLGEFNGAFQKGFGTEKFKCFNTVDELVCHLSNFLEYGDLLLVKASRTMKFENIVEKLQITKC